MKKPIRLIILFSAIAALVVIFLVITSPDPEDDVPPQKSADEIVRITDLAEGAFERIEVESSRGTLILHRENGEWTLDPAPAYPVRISPIREIDRALRTLQAERIIEESAENLSVFGLAPAQLTVRGFTDEGGPLVIHIGDQTPSKQAYYVRKEGDPRVYSVRSYSARAFFTSVEDLRPNRLAPIHKERLSYLYIDNGREIEIIPLDTSRFPLVAPFSSFMMMKPWATPRATDGEKMQALLDALPLAFTIQDYAADNPDDLTPFGLYQPDAEIILEDHETRLHLLIGDEDGSGNRYAVEKEGTSIVSISEQDLSFLNIPPFDLMDKFVLIINIDFVERFTLTAGEEQFVGEIRREAAAGEEGGTREEIAETYYIDGIPVEEQQFKQYYQKAIGLVFESENPNPDVPAGDAHPAVVIEYELNIPQSSADVSFFDFNRDFYTADLNGTLEFLISKDQVRRAVDAARELASLSD